MVAGLSTGVKLDAIHCLKLGKSALKSSLVALALQWLTLALEKSMTGGDESAKREKIVQALEKAIDKVSEISA